MARFGGRDTDWSSPGTQTVAITPNDGADISGSSLRGLYLGATGDVRGILSDDTSPQTFVGLAGGVVHPLSFKRIYATGTTATGILGVR